MPKLHKIELYVVDKDDVYDDGRDFVKHAKDIFNTFVSSFEFETFEYKSVDIGCTDSLYLGKESCVIEDYECHFNKNPWNEIIDDSNMPICTMTQEEMDKVIEYVNSEIGRKYIFDLISKDVCENGYMHYAEVHTK